MGSGVEVRLEPEPLRNQGQEFRVIAEDTVGSLQACPAGWWVSVGRGALGLSV